MIKNKLSFFAGVLLLITLAQLVIHYFFFLSPASSLSTPLKSDPSTLVPSTKKNPKPIVTQVKNDQQDDEQTIEVSYQPGDSLPSKLESSGLPASKISSSMSTIMEILSVKHLALSQPLSITLTSDKPLILSENSSPAIPSNATVLITVNQATLSPSKKQPKQLPPVKLSPAPEQHHELQMVAVRGAPANNKKPIHPKKNKARLSSIPQHKTAVEHSRVTALYTIQLAATQSHIKAKKRLASLKIKKRCKFYIEASGTKLQSADLLLILQQKKHCTN